VPTSHITAISILNGDWIEGFFSTAGKQMFFCRVWMALSYNDLDKKKKNEKYVEFKKIKNVVITSFLSDA